MKLLRTLSALALGCTAASAMPAVAQPWANTPDVSQVFVFGDSLSDGGAGIATVDAVCRSALYGESVCGERRHSVRFGQPFFQQRSYSDGPVAVEVMANLLGKPLPAGWRNPLVSSHFSRPGQNYAISSARAAGGGIASVVGLSNQLNAWVAHQKDIPPDPLALHVIFIGGNDLIAAIDDNRPQGVAAALKEIQDAITLLADRGARRFLVYKLLDLGDVPRYVAQPAKRALATSLTAQFNAGIDALTAPHGAAIHRFDMQAFWMFAKQFAYQQGLDYKQACMAPASDLFAGLRQRPGSDLVLDGNVLPACGSASALFDRLFFDDIHPSALLHQWLGQASYDFVVEQMTGRCAIQTWGTGTLAARGEPHPRRGLPGSLYGIDNTWNGKREYFRLTNLGADSAYWYFPTNERDNSFWEYLGNAAVGKTCGTEFRTNVNLWDARLIEQWGGAALGDFAPAPRNAVFLYHNPYRTKAEYFRFADPLGNGQFGYFPIDGASNSIWWHRITDGCLKPDGICKTVIRVD